MKNAKLYVAEFNRCVGDQIRRCAARLQRKGIPATVLPHRTSLLLERPRGMGWNAFLDAIFAELQPRVGSVLLHSRWSGVSRICRNFGNRRGEFISVEELL